MSAPSYTDFTLCCLQNDEDDSEDKEIFRRRVGVARSTHNRQREEKEEAEGGGMAAERFQKIKSELVWAPTASAVLRGCRVFQSTVSFHAQLSSKRDKG